MDLELDEQSDGWETEFEFEEIKNLRKKHFPADDENWNGSVEIDIRRKDNLEKPSESQFKALDFFHQNQIEVINQVCKTVYDKREELEDTYGFYNKESKDGFPVLESVDDVKKYINISTIYVLDDEKNGIAYTGYSGSATWEVEHGFGIMMHANQVIELGDWNTAYSGSHEIDKDNGTCTEEQRKKEEEEEKELQNNIAAYQEKVFRNKASFPDPQKEDVSAYVDLFDWLISWRAINGYRSIKKAESVEEKLKCLENLYDLDLANRKLEKLPESLRLLKNLRHLNLRINNLTALPESICELKRLWSLNVSVNQLKHLPPCLSNLEELESIDLSNNDFNHLPECIRHLKNLESIDIYYNQVTHIPEWIGELHKLEELRLMHNKFKKLPKSIENLKNLKRLYAFEIENEKNPWWKFW